MVLSSLASQRLMQHKQKTQEEHAIGCIHMKAALKTDGANTQPGVYQSNRNPISVANETYVNEVPSLFFFMHKVQDAEGMQTECLNL